MINYITNGERIDGENAPNGRPDILNRPLKEFSDGIEQGTLRTYSKNISISTEGYINTSVSNEDIVYLNSTTLVKSTPNTKKLGIYNSTKNYIFSNGEYSFDTRNDIQIGIEYRLSKTIPGKIVPSTDPDSSEVVIGIGIDSNRILLKIGYEIPVDSVLNAITDNIDSININADNIDSINTNATNIFDINIVGSDLTNQFTNTEDYGLIDDPVETGTGTSNIVTVSENINDVILVAENISNGWTGTIVAGNTITVVNGIITDVQ